MKREHVIGLCLVSLLGCERAPLRSVGGPGQGFTLDAGLPLGADAGPGASADAGRPPSRDAGGTPDAGFTSRCGCPKLPTTCTPPKLGAPITTIDRAAQEELLNLFSCAETSIRAALYQVEWDCVVGALYDRLGRAPDLTVEIIVDDDECPRGTDGRLSCALRDIEDDPRVSVLDDSRSRYMHHKFWVVDDRWVWTGSANMTKTSFCTDYNDSMVLADPALVTAYAERFAALYEGGEFGPQPRRAPVRSGPFTVHFGPQSPLSAAPSWHEGLLRSIAEARTRIDFGIFALTRDDIAEALAQAHLRGVQVRGVVHSRYATQRAATRLTEAGVPLRKASVHSKLLVVDTATVATGTPNWSSNAWGNNEDSLWIHDADLARQYQSELERVWMEASAP